MRAKEKYSTTRPHPWRKTIYSSFAFIFFSSTGVWSLWLYHVSKNNPVKTPVFLWAWISPPLRTMQQLRFKWKGEVSKTLLFMYNFLEFNLSNTYIHNWILYTRPKFWKRMSTFAHVHSSSTQHNTWNI
jgi:hypothetical protein